MEFVVIGIISFIVILAFVVFVVLTGPKARGKKGEREVGKIIGENIEGEKYVINDLILQNEGKTSQIDHIVILPNGIFVIETKNYSGTIYGSENQLEWVQVLAGGNVKNKLYNPLKQNATHVYCVKKLIGNLPIQSLVVFVKNNTYYIDAHNVIPLSALKKTLNNGEKVLSAEQMKYAYEILLSSKADITLKEHIYNIKQQQYNLQKGICPRCGGQLVVREGQYGKFYGCSNYPQCKFKKDLWK